MTPAPNSDRLNFVRALLVAIQLMVAPAAFGQDAAPPPTAATTSTNAPPAGGSATNAPASDEIQLSFQGANIDMVVQWLAQQTGKSVLKHPQAQCQLTIVGSKKMAPRQAISLVYRALAMEGFAAIESSNSILIVPEGREPKLDA